MKSQNPWLIIPTYNERDNLAAILNAAVAQPILGLSVCIVDDASPDGTGALADQLAVRLPSVQVIHRAAKGGLASAYVAGFRFALARGADVLFEMDADGSHDPAMLSVLLAAIENGADLVLGSRYVPGGGIVAWGATRRVVSRLGNWYARRVLGVPIRDLTGGFKCFRREVLECIDLGLVTSTGYHFQIELTTKAIRAGFRVREVPITFTERRIGRSKFHVGIVWESMLAVWRLRRSR